MQPAGNDSAVAAFRRGCFVDVKGLRVELAGEGQDLCFRNNPCAAIDDFTDREILKMTHLPTPHCRRRRTPVCPSGTRIGTYSENQTMSALGRVLNRPYQARSRGQLGGSS